jgi:cytochrome c oxidase cbb3-type subunit 1
MGTMGWVSLVLFAGIYYTVPKIYGRELFSIPLANLHFWLVLIGQLIYSVSMWIAGVMQASMWHQLNPDGSLTYTFMEALVELYPYWLVRALSGIIYLAGIVVFIYNIYMTARNGKTSAAAVETA